MRRRSPARSPRSSCSSTSAFFGANVLKIPHGGWFPLVVGALVYLLMTTWKTGRALLASACASALYPFDRFLQDISRTPPHRVPAPRSS